MNKTINASEISIFSRKKFKKKTLIDLSSLLQYSNGETKEDEYFFSFTVALLKNPLFFKKNAFVSAWLFPINLYETEKIYYKKLFFKNNIPRPIALFDSHSKLYKNVLKLPKEKLKLQMQYFTYTNTKKNIFNTFKHYSDKTLMRKKLAERMEKKISTSGDSDNVLEKRVLKLNMLLQRCVNITLDVVNGNLIIIHPETKIPDKFKTMKFTFWDYD